MSILQHHLSAAYGCDLSSALLQLWTQALGQPIRLSARHAVFVQTPTEHLKQAAFIAQHDVASLQPNLDWRDFSLLAMDMDSTLINIECIDEIADYCGKKQAVSAITEAAMRGEITDFSDSLRRRVALLKGLPLNALQAVLDERLELNPGAQTLIHDAHDAQLKSLLVSGGFTFFTDAMKARLGLSYSKSNQLLSEQGFLTGQVGSPIVDAEGKKTELLAACGRLGVGPTRAIAIGDGSNDLAMMGVAGLSIAYHAKAAVRAKAMVAIDFGGLDTVSMWLKQV